MISFQASNILSHIMDDTKSHIRITVVGDGNTGKTCMLIVYKDKKYDDIYIPTV